MRKTSEAVLQEDLTHAELPNLIYAGTTVAAGTGRAVVFATGMNTEFGKIAHLTQTVGEELSPLAERDGAGHQDHHDPGSRHRRVLLHPGHLPGGGEPGRRALFLPWA